MRLYSFDASLRTATFASLTPLELALRGLLGHALGTIDECAHLKPALLGPRADQDTSYATWIQRYKRVSLIRRKTSSYTTTQSTAELSPFGRQWKSLTGAHPRTCTVSPRGRHRTASRTSSAHPGNRRPSRRIINEATIPLRGGYLRVIAQALLPHVNRSGKSASLPHVKRSGSGAC
ncbi:Abi family protein [Paenarthrobacter sp. MMS21-TAE1-1]|uniref:Abi family protein n=1 Tax=Paenarthrobacter aromaticivorans TaxID=2849150 RepID=A0ABS6I9I1_9MICC|nr:Abi family protein [Paenarthrobacter sp. MMS21-TAE1-1]